MRRRRAAVAGALLVAPLLAAGADGGAPPATKPATPHLRFEEVSQVAGARLVHSTRHFAGLPKAQVLEMFTDGGAAVAVGDFDGDGRDDLFVTDSDLGKPDHLLWNRTPPGGPLAFTDVAAAAGVTGGNDADDIVADALWLDYDNDGREDLLVSRFGTPLLFHNEGPGEGVPARFREVSKEVGLTRFANTIAAIAFDYDNDGWLDLMLANYFPPVDLLKLPTPHVLPDNLDDAHNGGGVSLWHNVPAPGGAGRRFVEVTAAAGLDGTHGWSLDLGHADLDDDGWEDVYVAGDYGTDRLFHNRGDGTFEDVTAKAIGFDTRKGMNVDFGDFDRDGRLDIYVTNITDEYMKECNMLWHNNGDGTFVDVARETGTCDTDWGWAAKFGDFDNDGWQDLFVVDGLRSAGPESYVPVLLKMILTPGVDFSDVNSYPDIGDRSWSGYQKQRLFRNRGDGTFQEVGEAAGVANDLDGRGIGVSDLDGDGLLDLYQTAARQPTLLYHNVTTGAGHWVELDLVGTHANRDAIGARVVLRAGGESYLREVDGGNGFASQSSRRLHFGIGAATKVESVEIRWPGGEVETLRGSGGRPPVPVDAVSRIEEGKGVIER